MITVNIPGKGTCNYKHIVLDFNGTMAPALPVLLLVGLVVFVFV